VSRRHARIVAADSFLNASWNTLTDFGGDVLTLRDHEDVQSMIDLGPFDVISHQASITGVIPEAGGTTDPHKMMRNNVETFRGLLDFAVKITNESWAIEEEDREGLRRVGFADRDIWDIAAVAGFFNMSNRVASATDMRPNAVYHGQGR